MLRSASPWMFAAPLVELSNPNLKTKDSYCMRSIGPLVLKPTPPPNPGFYIGGVGLDEYLVSVVTTTEDGIVSMTLRVKVFAYLYRCSSYV